MEMRNLTARGHAGRHGGRVNYVVPPPWTRGTTNQLCGRYPFIGGGGPDIGVPIGPGIYSHNTICADPISWFARAKLIPNPSFFVLGLPGLGKSRFVIRLILGSMGFAIPLVLGDLKPDYVNAIRAIGGQVIPLGRGRGSLNILDPGQMAAASTRIGGRAGDVLREEGHGRRLGILRALLAVVRGSRTADWEDAVLGAALRLLNKRWARRKNPPVLADLIALIQSMPDEIRVITLDQGNDERYREAVNPLIRSLMALCDGALGEMFAHQTTHQLRANQPACYDISHISAGDRQLQSCALLACWNEGNGVVESANALADAGLEPQLTFLLVCDELWRPMEAGLVSDVNELTRLNRTRGVGQVLITHSTADMKTSGVDADIQKARGFIERAGCVVCFGLPTQELDELDDIVHFTQREKALITSWSSPPGWRKRDFPPGLGNLLFKVGGLPGVAAHLDPVPAEAGIHNTNERWAQ
jgi:hypothetical protein